jgi:glucose-6-phosphate 1-dehydrogenase
VDLSDREAGAARCRPSPPSLRELPGDPADLFVPTCEGLQAAGLLAAPSRLVLEKPIGHDLASARAINAALRGFLDESRIFRIDHYLGKAPVQNLLALRFGNTLMEAVGTTAGSTRSTSWSPRPPASTAARATTPSTARCATWCRTTCCSCWR